MLHHFGVGVLVSLSLLKEGTEIIEYGKVEGRQEIKKGRNKKGKCKIKRNWCSSNFVAFDIVQCLAIHRRN